MIEMTLETKPSEISIQVPDRLLFMLSDEWALSHDELQWIVMRYGGRAKGWRPTAYVTSTKLVLRRVIDELGIKLHSAGNSSLDQVPSSFREWRARFANSKTTC